MATTNGGNRCVKCGKQNAILKCGGCSQDFCYNHVLEHRQELNKQLDEIEINRDPIRQLLNEQTTEPEKHPLIQQINQWEYESIKKIKQTADETRKLLLNYTNENINGIELKLNNLTDRLKQGREENDFVEINLNEWKKQLIQLKEEINIPSNIKIGYDSTPLVTKIYADVFRDMSKPTEPAVDLKKSNNATSDSTDDEELKAGQTHHIQRVNPMLIPTNHDKFVATICCHNNQLIYNDYDRTTQDFRLIFLRDIANQTVKQIIDWHPSDTTINAEDDEWIQDIIYSDKLSSYLLLNRARLRVFKDETNELNEYYTFHDRIMKRLSCSDKYIYLISTHGSVPYNGDEIILMNYNKEERVCKTFCDIIPMRIRVAVARPLVGEISDLTVGSNEQVIVGYRLERRHEVGVCLFNVTNNGREWSCVKQLLLNECWHNNLSYTPRIDWCGKLNVFIVIEYMTGHLIMINQDGQVEGETLFMDVESSRESPLNLTVSANDWLCVRYESSISIHKLTS